MIENIARGINYTTNELFENRDKERKKIETLIKTHQNSLKTLFTKLEGL